MEGLSRAFLTTPHKQGCLTASCFAKEWRVKTSSVVFNEGIELWCVTLLGEITDLVASFFVVRAPPSWSFLDGTAGVLHMQLS